MQFECNLHAGAELTAMDTSVTSVLHQSLSLNFLPRLEKHFQCYAGMFDGK